MIKAMRELGMLEPDSMYASLSQDNDKHASWPSILAGVSNADVDRLPQALADKFNAIKARVQAQSAASRAKLYTPLSPLHLWP